MDLHFFNKNAFPETSERGHPPLPRTSHLLAPIRRLMAKLEQQRWFLPVITTVFMLATLEILGSTLPLPLESMCGATNLSFTI